MVKRTERIWNVPNILTMLRIALIGVFIWQFTLGRMMAAMCVFLLASATDFLDGFIARRYHLETDFGRLMDPLADKLMLISALVCLATRGLVPIWLIVAVAVKELVMVAGGYLLLKLRSIVVHARFIGKAATVAFILAVTATFLHTYSAPWDVYLQYLALALSVYAMVWYVLKAVRMVTQK
ncbi:CDP-alcohol phosphatidyltransferase family protein [Eubacteriales bacterium OttesenSCG-928-A19]|nr:CDP-alcohol phosphatidyltransferase family protein [Eubacteriales bacterium OttesenSCG-928-A19]